MTTNDRDINETMAGLNVLIGNLVEAVEDYTQLKLRYDDTRTKTARGHLERSVITLKLRLDTKRQELTEHIEGALIVQSERGSNITGTRDF